MKGRKPKPTHLKVLQGWQNSKINHSEPKPVGNLHKAPGDLPAGAVPYWNHAIASAPRGLLRRLDQRILVIYATAAWLHSEASNEFAKLGSLAVRDRNKAQKRQPLLMIVNQQAGIMMKAAAEMGFTPTSRSRIVVKEGELAEPENAFEEFA